MGNEQHPDKLPEKPEKRDINISASTMPMKKQQKIAKRLGGLHTKKDLWRELESSTGKLIRQEKQTQKCMTNLQLDIQKIEKNKIEDIKKVTESNILTLELIGFILKYYDHKLLILNRKYELAALEHECVQTKVGRIQKCQNQMRQNGRKWSVDDLRKQVEVAFHATWRIRMPQTSIAKTTELEVLEKTFDIDDLPYSYTSIMIILNGHTESDQQKKEKLTSILQTINQRHAYDGNGGDGKEMKQAEQNTGNEPNMRMHPQERVINEQDVREEQQKQEPSQQQEMNTVVNWLKNELDLSEYVDMFLEHGFDDMNVIIKTMDEQDLIDIGIHKKGHRKKILLHIKEHKHVIMPKMHNLDGNDDVEGHNVVDTVPGILLWKCPMCDSQNTQSALQCSICGYNISDNVEGIHVQ
eukprot:955016_1